MRKFLLTLALVMSAGAASAAPPTTESIDRLLKLTKVDNLVEGMHAQMEPYMRDIMRSATPGNVTPAQQKTIDELAPKLVQLMREEFNWKIMQPEYVRIYQEVFDQAEVDGLIAFYETPVGQSVITKMPRVAQRSMEVSLAQTKLLLPKVDQLVKDAVNKALGKP